MEPTTTTTTFSLGVFARLMDFARIMARSSTIPETLRSVKIDGKITPLPPEVVEANCFRIAEQAYRWEMSPFAVVDHASLVHGRLMWEGKLVNALLQTNGIYLTYAYSGSGDDMAVTVAGKHPKTGEKLSVSGSVRAWKTSGANSSWTPPNYPRQLAYRGSREWARMHSPAIMLGIVADDEELAEMKPAKAKVVVNEIPPPPALLAKSTESAPKPEPVKDSLAEAKKRLLAFIEAHGGDAKLATQAAEQAGYVSPGKAIDLTAVEMILTSPEEFLIAMSDLS